LAGEGARLFLTARREERLADLEKRIRASGGTAFISTLDLRRAADVDAMIQQACEKLGCIDVLINNAAFGYFGTVEKTPPDLAHEIFELNLHAPLRAIQLVVPIMRRQGGGHIINISSVAGRRGLPLSGIYCATKFALHGLTEALRVELKDSNIFVSLINPASTKTEFGDAVRRENPHARFKPIGPQQSAEDVARAIVECIRRPRLEVFPHWPSRFVAWANAIAPSVVDAFMGRILRNRALQDGVSVPGESGKGGI